MGKPKYVYFEDEIIEKLKDEPNASKLINELLRKHFEVKSLKTMTKEELELELKKAELKKEYEDKLKSIK